MVTRQQIFEALVVGILDLIGEDPMREGLQETPRRVAKAWLDELVPGVRQDRHDLRQLLKTFEIQEAQGILIVKGIPLRSLCEHHLLPFWGTVSIGYIPDGKVLGISKLSRVVDYWARRPQVQERLTAQVADTLFEEPLSPKGVLVVAKAIHSCMSLRGVNHTSETITSEARGLLLTDASARLEAIQLIQGG